MSKIDEIMDRIDAMCHDARWATTESCKPQLAAFREETRNAIEAIAQPAGEAIRWPSTIYNAKLIGENNGHKL